MWAYFDDSEYYPDEDIPEPRPKEREFRGRAIAFGGCVATLEGWCRILPDWDAVLEAFETAWFHASDLQQSRGQFQCWRYRPGRADELWRSLIAILDKHVIAYVGCTMPEHHVRRFMTSRPQQPKRGGKRTKEETYEDQWINMLRRPYSYCFACCMRAVAELAKERREKVGLVFAKQDGLKGNAGWLYELAAKYATPFRDYLSDKSFDGDPRILRQLQAADLVAYELTRYLRPAPLRWQYRSLRAHRHRFHVEDPPRLTRGWL